MRAQLICKIPPAVVEFDFNPKEIGMSRSANSSGRPSASAAGGKSAGSTGSIFKGSAQSTISIGPFVLQGGDTKARCDQLLQWMSPGGGLLGQVVGAALSAATGGAINLATKLPQLTFMWGPPAAAFMYECTLSSCDIKYKRFDTSGIPSRAEVTIKLTEQPSLLGSIPTNPTSGGLPGRHIHTVSDGENLQTISTATYGAPRYWRAIAAVNGIDDPMRVAAGTHLFLPNANELLEGSTR
jgi:nucleoid-associated protein YgaU